MTANSKNRRVPDLKFSSRFHCFLGGFFTVIQGIVIFAPVKLTKESSAASSQTVRKRYEEVAESSRIDHTQPLFSGKQQRGFNGSNNRKSFLI